jgi:hypothetical protein
MTCVDKREGDATEAVALRFTSEAIYMRGDSSAAAKSVTTGHYLGSCINLVGGLYIGRKIMAEMMSHPSSNDIRIFLKKSRQFHRS